MPGPKVLDDHIRFHHRPLDPTVTGVALDCDPAVPGSREFARIGDLWELELPRPALDRLEYRLTLLRGADAQTVIDEVNPVRVPTAFGDRSVLLMPGYAAPAWLDAPVVEGTFTSMALPGETDDAVPVTMWSPAGVADLEPLPLLLVHDGPEYDLLSSLTRFCGAMIAAGRVAPHRVALAHPVLRDAWYSGSPQYLRTVAHAGLPRIREQYAVHGPVVVMGASLGGLTALLVGLLGAPEIGAVFAQSGSFFQVRHDHSESGFPYFLRISHRVQQVLDARHADHPLRVGMTCGAMEENAPNNRDMAAALRRAGHDVRHVEVRDLHNYTAWRDGLDPTLTDVLRDVWGAEGRGWGPCTR